MARMLTELQRDVFLAVVAAWSGGGHYRASQSGERPTLASLYRCGLLSRRAWRGVEGEPSAAYEYAPAPAVQRQIKRRRAGR